VIGFRVCLREGADHFARPESDLETARRTPPEDRVEIERGAREIHADCRPDLAERALLCGRHPAGA